MEKDFLILRAEQSFSSVRFKPAGFRTRISLERFPIHWRVAAQPPLEPREQVMGFYLPGVLAGLDGLADGDNQWNLVALEASSPCTVTHKHLVEGAVEVPEFLSGLMRQLSGDMLQVADLATGNSAEARLAAFMIDIAGRWGAA